MRDRKALTQAIDKEDLQLVKRLIDAGCDLNVVLPDGRLPLASSAATGNSELVRLLLQAGAAIDAGSGPNLDTALTLATYRGHDEVVNALILCGADVNRANSIPLSPVCIAASRDSELHANIVRSLVRAGADLDSARGATALMCACRGLSETARVLLEAGADANAMRSRGTALHIAIEENRPDIVAVLLQYGANTALQTPATAEHPGLTAQELAKQLKRRKILPLLESAKSLGESVESQERGRIRSISWTTLAQLIQEQRPFLAASFQTGATSTKIDKLEKAIGHSLPEAFRNCYLMNNGQRQSATALVPPRDFLDSGYRLLSIAEIMSSWNNYNQLLEEGEFRGKIVTPDKGIRKDWWNSGWVPFAGNDHGDFLCLDLVPTSSGTTGQVISMSHEKGRRELLAPSFDAWLSGLFVELEDSED